MLLSNWLLSICLIFCQFQPGVAYKNVAYIKKKRVPENHPVSELLRNYRQFVKNLVLFYEEEEDKLEERSFLD